MTFHRRQMAAIQGPKRQTTTQLAQQWRPVRRQDIPRPQDDCQ